MRARSARAWLRWALRASVALPGLGGAVAASAQPTAPVAGPPLGVTGTVRFHGTFPSVHVAARHVEVWLPPGYERDSSSRYPVLYMHDGQNAFNPATSFAGVDWAVDETMTRLVAERRVRPAIVVAVWNSPARFAEYMPRKAVADGGAGRVETAVPGTDSSAGGLRSDAYLRFLVEELKPFVDRAYRTRPGPADTFVMGSSMGGLISLYALTEHPRVFGAAACLSTHWPAGDGAMLPYLRRALPSPSTQRVYFDHGTATLDSLYAPLQREVDALMRAGGFVEGRSWTTRVFPGAEHSERAWRVRVEEPLIFLLGR